MQLVCHGGMCCGIKTIYGFSAHPARKLPAMKPLTDSYKINSDQHGRYTSSADRFFHNEAPAETYEERLVRYIDFVKEKRPKHLIEAALTHGGFNMAEDDHGWLSLPQDKVWGPVLKKYGFKPVTTFVNSNTKHEITVYHLVIE